MKDYEKILVATDFSRCSNEALEQALRIAERFSARLDVVHCWTSAAALSPAKDGVHVIPENAESKALMDELITRLPVPDGVEVSGRVEYGAASEVLVELSSRYDLLVLGTHGRKGLSKLVMGSVAQKVVQAAMCPVLSVREEPALKRKLERPAGEHIVYGLFDGAEPLKQAQAAIADLGVRADAMSLFISEERHQGEFEFIERTQALKGATAGGLFAGAIGGIVGGLVSLGAVTGGIGLLVMGPAVAFAAAGSVAGGLIGWGLPEERAKRLQEAVQGGQVLLAVHADDAEVADRVEKLLDALASEAFQVQA